MGTTLHKDLTGADLHVAKLHAATHVAAGTDPLVLAESQVTDLLADLADLVSNLSGKAPTVHLHVKTDITDFPILIPGTGNGDVVGSPSVTPGHLAMYADETGKLIEDGGAIPTLSGLGAEAVANKSTSVPTDAASDVRYPSVKAVKDYADGLLAGLLSYRGAYDASGNAYPAAGGSGTAGAVMKGDMWAISVAGALGSVAIQVGDMIIAKINTPAQTAANWNTLNTNVSYVPEDQANKENTTLDTSTVKYPTNALVKAGLDGKVATGDARLSDARVASDVSAWAKAGAKPSYTYTEVGAPSSSDSGLIQMEMGKVNGNGVDWNAVVWDTSKRLTLSQIAVPNYSGQTNYPFNGYGTLLTIGSDATAFPLQIAISDNATAGIKYRCQYNTTTFSNPWITLWTSANFTPPTSLPASDVSAWAKAASNVAIPGALGCNGKTAQAAYYGGPALAGFITGTVGMDTASHFQLLINLVSAIRTALIANGIMS